MSNADKNENNLRKKAGNKIEKKDILIDGIPLDNIESLPLSRIKNFIRDLHVHQTELEMQNDELRRTCEELEIIKSRYSDLYDLSPVGYITVTEKGIIEELNFTAAFLLGTDLAEGINKPFSRFIFSEDQDVYSQYTKKLFKTHETQLFELRTAGKDGTLFWVQIKAVTAVNENKETECRLVMRNISERKENKEVLLESEEKYRALFEKSGNGIFVYDPDTMLIIDANHAMSELYGYRYDELIGMNCLELSAEVEKSKKASSDADKEGRFQVKLRWHKKKDGTVFPLELDGYKILLNKKPVSCVVVKDITEYKRAEELLIRSECRFKTAFSMSPDAVNINRLSDGKYIDVNEGFTLLTGYSREDVIGKTSYEINIWGNPEDRKKLVQGLKEQGLYSNLEANFRKKDGSLTTALMSASVIDLDGEPHILSITRDISKRKQVETALMHEKELLAVTLRSIGDGVISTDIDGNITMLNKAAEEITGWKSADAFGKALPEVFKIINEITREKCKNPHENVLKTGAFIEMEENTCLIAKDGREITVGDSLAPIYDTENRIIGVVLVFRDISEKQKLSAALQRTQKLESLGILAGGIAHDFNNLLGGIFGYIEIAAEKTTEEKVSINLAKSLKSIDRARALTRQLLTFSRGGDPTKKVDSLFPFIKETVQFALSGSSVSCSFQIQENLWLCNFDKSQIGQAIDNLILNAQQAMPDGGLIEISASNISFSEKDQLLFDSGNYLKISIKDQGRGIPKESLTRIFDPYYTTNPESHGLGLAVCYSIISRHGGYIEVDSAPGKGSTFTIYLPASTECISDTSTKIKDMHTGKGTFLVMEDDEFIQDIIKEYLESFGYEVVIMENGEKAVDFFIKETRAKRKFSGIIFDLTVSGGMGGKDAVNEIRKICPDILAFVTSGYSEDPVMAKPEEYGFNASIHKPFLKTGLSEMLDKYLKNNDK